MNFLFTTTIIGAPIIGFMIMFSEACNQLNIWSKSLVKQLDSDSLNKIEILEECSEFFKRGIKITNSAFSRLLLWILTLYLTIMILATYFSMSFLFRTTEEKLSSSQILRSITYLFGATCIFLTVYFINYLSNEVTHNLHKLKECILQLNSVNLDTKWKIVEQMNSFHGFDACGYFILGKPLITTMIASFSTFIIVLIQFKMGEKSL